MHLLPTAREINQCGDSGASGRQIDNWHRHWPETWWNTSTSTAHEIKQHKWTLSTKTSDVMVICLVSLAKPFWQASWTRTSQPTDRMDPASVSPSNAVKRKTHLNFTASTNSFVDGTAKNDMSPLYTCIRVAPLWLQESSWRRAVVREPIYKIARSQITWKWQSFR